MNVTISTDSISSGRSFSVAFYRGHYTASNISSANELSDSDGVGDCFAYPNWSSYTFAPKSDIITYMSYYMSGITTTCSSTTFAPTRMSNGSIVTPTGGGCRQLYTTSTTGYEVTTEELTSFSGWRQYYNTNSSKFINFPSGEYTFVAGDIWDDYVILYFTVD